MITSNRDYLMRLIDEVGRLLEAVILRRSRGEPDEPALQTIVMGMQQLLGATGPEVFRHSPDRHYEMLTRDEAPEFALRKALLYAALSAEAGGVLARRGKPDLARASYLTALRFTLKARAQYPSEPLPSSAPDPDALLALLAGQPLDPDTARLVFDRDLNRGVS